MRGKIFRGLDFIFSFEPSIEIKIHNNLFRVPSINELLCETVGKLLKKNSMVQMDLCILCIIPKRQSPF